uniref:Transmembrane protein 14C n=1 Tax=Sinocyclocheilus rhinocerous TaxID=307959 RepID=A0A673HHR3_9TELE
MAVDWFGYGYAALITIGGFVGYAKAGSVISLVAGLMFGIAAFVGAYQMSKNDKDIWVSLVTFCKHYYTREKMKQIRSKFSVKDNTNYDNAELFTLIPQCNAVSFFRGQKCDIRLCLPK